MKSVITLAIALAMLALQYWLGTRRKPLLGALLPGGILLLLAGLSIALRDPPACWRASPAPRGSPPPGSSGAGRPGRRRKPSWRR